jgi:hypothetical protein
MDDAPSRGLERRVQAALGIGSIALGAGTASTTAAAASKAIPLLSFGVAKWVGIVAIGTGAAVGAAVVHHEAALRKPFIAPLAAAAQVGPGAIPALSPPMRLAPETSARPLDIVVPEIPTLPPVAFAPLLPLTPRESTPDRGAVARPVAGAAVSAEVPVKTTGDLVSELALLDVARRALDSGDTSHALTTLDRHDLEFAHGDLAPESLALRIEVYAQRRDDGKVRELGQSFLAQYPTHPQSRRVRALIDASGHR